MCADFALLVHFYGTGGEEEIPLTRLYAQFKTNYITEAEYKALDSACTSIRVMLIASVNTVKSKQ